MTQQISSLTVEQAQRALLLFYDMLPNELWEGQTKLSVAEIEALADELQDSAPTEIQPIINTLLTGDDKAVKGEAAKMLLQELWQYELLRPYVEQAVTRAEEPHMAPIPIVIGAFIIVLAVLPGEIPTKYGPIKFGHLEDAAKLIGELRKFVMPLQLE